MSQDVVHPGDDATSATSARAVAGAADVRTADRRILRRSLVAGTLVTVGLTVLTAAANVLFGGDGASAAVWALSSLVVGLLVSAGWMILALGLDLIAGQVPSVRRVAWTVGLFAAAFVSPVLPAAMLQVAGRAGP